MAVTLRLEDDLDVSRGDMICRPTNQPTVNRRFEATDLLVRRDLAPAHRDVPYQLKHTTRWVAAEIEELRYRLDVDTLHRDLAADTLEVNDIGRVAIHTTSPLFFDEYRINRTTGSFILVDPATDLTVAAGMIIGAGGDPSVSSPRRPPRSSPRTSPSTRASSPARSAGGRWKRAARRSG